MTIGILTTSYPRHPDDWAGRFVAELAGWLAAQGDAVEVIAPDPARTIEHAVPVKPIRYARHPRLFYRAGAPDNLLGSPSLVGRMAAWSQVPSFVGRLTATCWSCSGRWQRLLSHWLLPCGVVAGAFGRGLPHLVVAHSSDVHLLARLPAANKLLRLVARPRTALVLTSEALREPLDRLTFKGQPQRSLVRDAKVVPMGVHAAGQPRPVVVGRRVSSPLRVIFIGRLIALKGVDLLLEACAGLPVELVIVGDGPERTSLETLAVRLAIDARFLGEQGRTETWRQLVAADVLVLPSRVLADGRTDSAPLVVMEALVAGVVVVASRVGGVQTLIRNGRVGLTFAAGDVRALRCALLALARDRTRLEEMAAAALERGKRFSWDHAGQRLREQLLSL